MNFLSKERPSLSAFLSDAKVVSSSNSSIDLKFSSGCGFSYREVSKRQNIEDLKRFLCQSVGTDVEVNITLDRSVSEGSEQEQRQNYFSNQPSVSSNINDEIEREPIIKSILEIFDGEIV